MSPPPSQRRLALAGLLTGLAGMATSTATSWILRSDTSPVVAVGSAVRDLTPGPLAEQLVHVVQHADKPLLVVGTAVILLALCAFAGTQAIRRPLVPDLIFVALALIGLGALFYEDETGIANAIALVVGLVTWIVVLRFLTAPTVVAVAPERRTFLLRSSGVVVAGALALGVGRVAGHGRRVVDQARRLLRLPATPGSVPSDANLDVAGIASWRTPNSDFYRIHTAITVPSIAPVDWSLRIHGMVDRPLTLSYDDLANRRFTEDWVTICCVSNPVGGPLIGNAWWSGVLIRDVLAEVGVHAGADAVKQTSQDNWTCGTPLGALTDPKRNAMLALAMNGQPLPIEHGFPVRMIVPGLYGYVSATKWLVDLEVTRFDKFQAFWTERGWSEKGPIRTESRIDVPGNGDTVKAGTVGVGGSAWAQHTGIAKVEYQFDGGPWQQATLGGVPNQDTWVQWSGVVQAGAGDHKLVVRATDRSGYTQTSALRDVVPNGATGWDTVGFSAS